MPTATERDTIRRFRRARTPEQLADLFRDPTPEEARALVLHLGERRFHRFRELARRVGTDRGIRGSTGNVVVLPGIMGSLLGVRDLGSESSALVWVHRRRILFGWLDTLGLADDGARPADPQARYTIETAGVMNEYYGETITALGARWNVRPFAYDWRRDIRQTSTLLEGFLRTEFAGQPATLVAHSMGGLVARALLARNPRTDSDKPLVERLIMLGTPNRGSFEVPLILTGLQATVRKLALLAYPRTAAVSGGAVARAQLLRLVNTFPGVYQLLPHDVPGLLEAARYEAVNPTVVRKYLDLVPDFYNRIDRPADRDRMAYVAGYDQPTVVGVKDLNRPLADLENYRVTLAGDGKVPHDRGLMEDVATFFVRADHAALPTTDAVLGALDELIETGSTDRLPSELPTERAAVDLSAAWAEQQRQAMQAEEETLIQAAAGAGVARRGPVVQDGGLPPDPGEDPDIVDPVDQDMQQLILAGVVAPPAADVPGAPSVPPLPDAPRKVARVRIRILQANFNKCHDSEVQTADDYVPDRSIDAVAVGIYKGTRAVWAAIRDLDDDIASVKPETGRVLTDLIGRGVIRGDLAVPTLLPDPRDSTGNRQLVIVGMGSIGQFGTPEARLSARELAWSLGRVGKSHLATLLIGAGKDNLSVRDAMTAFLNGVAEAIAAAFAATPTVPVLREITFVEFFPDRVPELDDAIRARILEVRQAYGVELAYDPVLPPRRQNYAKKPRPAPRADEVTAAAEDRPVVRMTTELTRDTYWFGAQTADAAVPQRPVEIDPRLIADANDRLVAARSVTEQHQAGFTLGRLLIPADFRGRFAPGAPLVLEVDAATARIHWEMVVQPAPEAAGRATGEFLGLARGLTRQLRTRFAPPPEAPPDPRRTLRVLVVADPAPDGRLRGAELEGAEVADLFEAFNQYASPGCRTEVTRLIGPIAATRYVVLRHLLTTEYDVLHYAGHCFFDPLAPAVSGWLFRLNLKEVLSSRELRRVDAVPRFVFSNACESGITPDRPEGRHGDLAPAFAEAFFDRGVTNFVCTAWPVNDSAARVFARYLYAALLGIAIEPDRDRFRVTGPRPMGPEPMVTAVREAREAVARFAPGLRTWGAYQHYGNPFARFFPRWTGVPVQVQTTAGAAPPPTPPSDGAGPPVPPQKRPAGPERFAAVRAALRKHGPALRAIPGVVAVRPGFKFTDGWITDEPAIVVTVEHRAADRASVPDGGLVPPEVDGVPVDLAAATPFQQVRVLVDRGGDVRAAADAVPPIEEPDWLRPGEAPEIVPEDDLDTRSGAKYQPPPGVPLDSVTAAMKVNCHLSPDVGWPTLAAFLGATRDKLVVGMYDFTAPHIQDALVEQLPGKEFTLVLDPKGALKEGGGGTKANDVPEEEVRDAISEAVDGFRFVWAAVKRKGRVSAGLFPQAYHIKVAVRDQKAFWLSSGNWQSTNQPPPDFVPAGTRELRPIWRKYNREWHVILEHAGLAKVLEAYLLSDFDQALPLQEEDRAAAAVEPPMPDLLVPIEMADERAPAEPVRKIPAKKFDKSVTVQPILTPDNYPEHVLKLVKSAKHKLLFQNQYVRISKSVSGKFASLLTALKEKSLDPDIEFKMILRDGGDAREMLEALAAFGFDLSNTDEKNQVRIQTGCHTKGIVVDGQRVLIGSHNWSDPGVTRNRDASLLFDDAEIAAYFEEAFLHDWDALAREKTIAERAMPILAPDDTRAPVPAGFIRVAWDEYVSV